MPHLILRFADGEDVACAHEGDETVLACARRHGLPLATDCEDGDCQTCRGEVLAGEVGYAPGQYVSLSDGEREAGAALCCIGRPSPGAIIALPYKRAELLAARRWTYMIEAIERPGTGTALVHGRMEDGPAFHFFAGQYVNLAVPGSAAVRAYSMASPPGAARVSFHVRRLANGGAMTDYLARARPGDALSATGPHGVFYLRDGAGPILMVAGGTGLAPMAAMLARLAAAPGPRRPVVLCFGVSMPDDLYFTEALDDLRRRHGALEVRIAVAKAAPGGPGVRGLVTDLLGDADVADPRTDAYLCGPPPMIDAARAWLGARKVARIFTEAFTPAGG